jgi:hypothetical protein
MDTPTRNKLLAVLLVLLLAVVWIVVWSGVLGGNPNKPPALSDAERTRLEDENNAEKAKNTAENGPRYPNGKPRQPVGS